MGIKYLWPILSPFCARKPLYELQNKKVAIDLSCWVCEAQNITEYSIQPRMYLRNLYFRTCYLLLMGVDLVFVLEGPAPALKFKTIAARNALQFKGTKPNVEGGKDRTRFNYTLKQCEEMLKLMGLSCIKGNGEAEALCAHLNEDGLVDGIISQDSDCFAYGARVVYRNFSISQQGNFTAQGGSVDVYDITKVRESMDFGRNKVIVLALLCGSDYSEGVHGIGKDSVIKLFNTVSDSDILHRIRSWPKQDSLFEEFEQKLTDKSICTSCGHPGKLQSHNSKGCLLCKTQRGCDFNKFKLERLDIKNELNMRKKAITDKNFPDEELINEFLDRKDNISELNLKWGKPDLINFIKFTVKYLTWKEIYSLEKILPVLTRWQLLHYTTISDNTKGVLTPKFIKKRRNPKGTPSYEIIWYSKTNEFDDIIPKEQLLEYGDLEKLWSTIEPQMLVKIAYPKLAEDFENSNKPKTRKKKANPVEDLEDLMGNVSISEPTVKKKKKPSKKKQGIKTLDSFLLKSSTPVKRNLDQSNFGDENDLEISDLVDDIVLREAPAYVPINLEKMGLKLINESCDFFTDGMKEDDLFEQSVTEYLAKYNSEDDNDLA